MNASARKKQGIIGLDSKCSTIIVSSCPYSSENPVILSQSLEHGNERKEARNKSWEEMMTISEQLFEQYCNEQGISYQRIEEGLSKTPDYFVNVDSLDIVIEVKQVDQRKEDDAVL